MKSKIKRAVLCGSGKGGTGKSTVSCLVALELVKRGYKVGLFDADTSGPSIPKILGVTENLSGDPKQGIIPQVTVDGLQVVSLDLFLNKKSTAILWNGLKISDYILTMLKDISWNLDYLIVDLPPNTSDSVQSTIKFVQEQRIPSGILFVSSPQKVSLNDIQKSISMAHRLNEPILGMIENLSKFTCPNCKTEHYIFGKDNVKEICKQEDIAYLGSMDILPQISDISDNISLNISNIPDIISSPLKDMVDIIERSYSYA